MGMGGPARRVDPITVSVSLLAPRGQSDQMKVPGSTRHGLLRETLGARLPPDYSRKASTALRSELNALSQRVLWTLRVMPPEGVESGEARPAAPDGPHH